MPVSGFGNGNGFLFPDFPIKKFEYSYLTGILTFTTGYIGLLSFTIPVGKGYNDTLFEIVADNYIQGKHYKNNFLDIMAVHLIQLHQYVDHALKFRYTHSRSPNHMKPLMI